MNTLLPTLYQMIFLFAFICLGFVLTKLKFLPESSAPILSKLENMIFIPALIMGTFIKNFTLESLSVAWKVLLFSFVLELFIIPIVILISRLCAKDKYTRNVYTYGLAFSNFSFMGNAIVAAIFPSIFTEYILFTIPLWSIIYLWGVPSLLLAEEGQGKRSLGSRLKPFLNPMIICTFIGMIIGITGIGTLDLSAAPVLNGIRESILSVIDSAGSCMSPVAMLLTGITLGSIDLKKTLGRKSIYAVSLIRLLAIPLVAVAAFLLFPNVSELLIICTICSLAMPLGLGTIVIPSAYGKDTSTAAGMTLISQLLSVVTIPVVFMIMDILLL